VTKMAKKGQKTPKNRNFSLIGFKMTKKGVKKGQKVKIHGWRSGKVKNARLNTTGKNAIR